jgi:hypothetical protein
VRFPSYQPGTEAAQDVRERIGHGGCRPLKILYLARAGSAGIGRLAAVQSDCAGFCTWVKPGGMGTVSSARFAGVAGSQWISHCDCPPDGE